MSEVVGQARRHWTLADRQQALNALAWRQTVEPLLRDLLDMLEREDFGGYLERSQLRVRIRAALEQPQEGE